MRLEDFQDRNEALLDGLLLMAAIAVVAAWTYHPYYFGDELFSFNFARERGRSFQDVFGALNEYKPRVLMNALWALIVSEDLPRLFPMLLNSVGLGGCSLFVYVLCRRQFASSRPVALLAASAVVFSRFSVMLYWDYVSGTVETLSLACLLGAIVVSPAVFLHARLSAPWRMAGSFVLLLCAVTIHERYVAGIFGLAGAIVLIAIVFRRGAERVTLVTYATVISLASLALVIVLTKTISEMPLTTGTSGQQVVIGLGTAKNALTYLSNVFLGSNFGPNWFVGALNQNSPHALLIFGTWGAIFAALWLAAPVWKGRASLVGSPLSCVSLLCAALGMLAVASLPSSDRQEARWMFPVVALVVLATVSLYSGRTRALILTAMLLSSLFYVVFGSIGMIASISASKSAKSIGTLLRQVDFGGNSGVILGATEPDTSWVLGGDGVEFCRLNGGQADCIYPQAAATNKVVPRIDFGITPIPALDGGLRFRLLNAEQVAGLLDPRRISDQGLFLGDSATWPGWKLGSRARITPGGLEVGAVADTFIAVPECALDGAFLVLEAKAMVGNKVPMRLQVNWNDSAQQFIAAQIQVVEVMTEKHQFSAMLNAPQKAKSGMVYATLHDGADGVVLIESMRLSGGRGDQLPSGGNFTCRPEN